MTGSFSSDKKKNNGSQEFIEHASPPTVAVVQDDSHIAADGEDEINRFVWFLSLVGGLSGFLFGWDTACVGGALANIGDALGHELNHVESEWAVASLSVGAIVGTLIGGSYSDKIGRKAVLAIGDVLFIIGGVLICASYSLAQFIVARVIMGGGVGIAAVVCAVYLGEVAPSMHRGRIIAVQSVMITGGQLVAYAVSAGLEDVNHGWRIIFALSLPFAILQFIGMHWFLPETPRFAVLTGDLDGARNTLRKIYPKATPDQLELKLQAIVYATEASVALKKIHPTLMGRLGAIFRTPKYFRCVLSAAVIFLGQQLVGWNSFLYYSNTLFGAAGFSNTSAVGILVAGLNCVFTVFSMLYMDRIGRRRMFLICGPIVVISLVVASVAFHMMTESTGGKLFDGVDYPKQWVGLMLGMLCLFIVGNAPSLGTLAYTTIELIPLEVRGIGSSIAVACQWSGNTLVGATFLSLLNGVGAAGTYAIYAVFGLLTFTFIYFCYPETSGLTLEQVGHLFDDGFGVKAAQRMRQSRLSTADVEAV